MKGIEFANYEPPHELCCCLDVDESSASDTCEIMVAIEAPAISPADFLIIQGCYPDMD